KVEVMKHLAVEPEISKDEFEKANINNISDQLYHQTKDFYSRKLNAIREQMTPTLKQMYEQNGDRIENIVVPVTDGNKGIQIYANLKESVEHEARPVVRTLEKTITLAMIDEQWKDHLRAMDDLRTSVRMASYEPKDPLLIYKFEAFN